MTLEGDAKVPVFGLFHSCELANRLFAGSIPSEELNFTSMCIAIKVWWLKNQASLHTVTP